MVGMAGTQLVFRSASYNRRASHYCAGASIYTSKWASRIQGCEAYRWPATSSRPERSLHGRKPTLVRSAQNGLWNELCLILSS
jgi:hypothetical protein